MPKTCATCQFNDNGYCQKFDDEMAGYMTRQKMNCSEYMPNNQAVNKNDCSPLLTTELANEIIDKNMKKFKASDFEEVSLKNTFNQTVNPSWEEYKRKCKHKKIVHWEKCAECREYLLTEHFRQTIKEERAEERKKTQLICYGWADDAYKQAVKEAFDEVEKFELDDDYSGRQIESMAEQFGVPVSVMAIRLFDIKKEKLLKIIKEKFL